MWNFQGPGMITQMGYGNGMQQLPPGTVMAPPATPDSPPKAVFRYGEQAIWSTQGVDGVVAAAAVALNSQVFRLFSTGQNNNGQGYTTPLTISETNLRIPGQLPGNEAFDVYGLSLQIIQYTTALCSTQSNGEGAANTDEAIGNLINVQNNCVLAWDFTKTQVQVAPAVLIGTGGGAYGGISTTIDATNRGHINNGAGTYWLYNRYPVALPGTTVFNILLQFGSHAAVVGSLQGTVASRLAIGLRVAMLGYYKSWIEVG